MASTLKPDHRIVILGAGTVGKSAITVRMVSDQFQEVYDATIEDRYQCDIAFEGGTKRLDILDTAGQEQFESLQHHWIREGEGFLLVYAVDKMETFTHCSKLYETINRVMDGEHVNLVLVGNKSDLAQDEHEVSTAQGEALAKKWGVPLVLTSAKTNSNINETFQIVIKEILKHEQSLLMKQEVSTGSGCCLIL